MIVTSVQIKTVKMQKHLYCPVFTKKRFEQAKREALETARWAVSIAECVPASAEASRANLSICAKE